MLEQGRVPDCEDWFFLDSPGLHGIPGRVLELDSLARLARYQPSTLPAEDEDPLAWPPGQLAIMRAVEVDTHDQGPRILWGQVLTLRDPVSGAPLAGEPDGRVITAMRMADTWSAGYLSGRSFRRHTTRERARAERRSRLRLRDQSEGSADRAVHEYQKAAGLKQRAWISKAV